MAPPTRFVSSTISTMSSTATAPAEDPKDPYVGLDLLQEQTRLKAIRKGYRLNLMVAGRSGLGKSTLVNTLFKTQVTSNKECDKVPSTTQIRSTSCSLNEKGVKLYLTVTDTPGFGDQINNANCWDPLIEYIEAQYCKYLQEEQKVKRSTRIEDSRVHCCLYFVQPSGHALSSLDIEVLKRLSAVVNVVPVIAKADTLTIEERQTFKERIRADLADHKVRIYPDVQTEDKEDAENNAYIRQLFPFAIVGSTSYHDVHGKKILGRKCNWGLVEVENKNHSDFPVLRDMLIRTHMTDLVELTSTYYYEIFRQEKLTKTSKGEDVVDQGVENGSKNINRHGCYIVTSDNNNGSNDNSNPFSCEKNNNIEE